MSGKRVRIGSSSSFIEKDLLDNMAFPVESARQVCDTTRLVSEKKPSKCLKPSVHNNGQLLPHERGLGEFLKSCYFCKEIIKAGKDVFMYRDHAYCKEKCRAYHIVEGDKIEKAAEVAGKAANTAFEAGNSKKDASSAATFFI